MIFELVIQCFLLVRVAVRKQSRDPRMTAGSTTQVRRIKNDRGGNTSGGCHFVYMCRAQTRFMTVAGAFKFDWLEETGHDCASKDFSSNLAIGA